MINVTSNSVLDCTDAFNNETVPAEYILWMANERLYHINLPTVVFYIIAIIVGIFGNSLVIYVFRFRFKRTTANIFIVCLSSFDMITCFMLIFEVFDKRLPMYSGNYPAVCKLVRCVEVFANGGASVILVGIAFDRYYKICKPFKRLSMTRVRNLIITTVFVMVLASWPMLLFHGSETVDTNHMGISGRDCADDDNFKGSIYPGIYFIILFVFIIVCMGLILILYSLVFAAILRWKRRIVGEDVRMMSLSESTKSTSSASLKQKSKSKKNSNEDTPYTIANASELDNASQYYCSNVCNSLQSEYEASEKKSKEVAHSQNHTEKNKNSKSKSTGVVNEGFTVCDEQLETDVYSDKTRAMSCTTIHNYTENNMSKTAISNKLVIEKPIKDAVQEQQQKQKQQQPQNQQQQQKQQRDYVVNGSMSINRRKISLKVNVKLLNFKDRMRRKSSRKADVRTSATTLVFSMIALLYILSYIPTIVVESINAIHPLIEENLPESTRKIVVMANSAYFINGALNPLLYGLFNKAFRDELILILKGNPK